MMGFILTRHVRSAQTNQYWLECVRKIRQFYSHNLVVIIDDHSDPQYLTAEAFPNCIVLKSEFPKRGELLPYYYLNKYKFFEKAVILHDSVFVQEAVNFNAFENLPLWHFTYPLYENEAHEQSLLRVLDNNEELLKAHSNREFRGAFGCMSVVTLPFVARLEGKYKISKLLNYVNSRPLRMALERVFGVLFTVENPAAVSIFGTIQEFSPWGVTFLQYIQKKTHRKAVVKVWSGR